MNTLIIDKSTYSACDFSNKTLETEQISRVKFENCDFRRADFSDVDTLYSCTFDECNFTNARLNGVTFKDCAFLSCQLKNTSLFAVTLEDCKMTGTDFTDSDCGLMRIIGGDFSYTVLRKQAFQKSDLSNIRFFGADLTECHFNNCKMNNCDFSEAIAYKTSFYKSDIRRSSLLSFNISEASFRFAKLDLEQCVQIAEFMTEGRYTPDEAGK